MEELRRTNNIRINKIDENTYSVEFKNKTEVELTATDAEVLWTTIHEDIMSTNLRKRNLEFRARARER